VALILQILFCQRVLWLLLVILFSTDSRVRYHNPVFIMIEPSAAELLMQVLSIGAFRSSLVFNKIHHQMHSDFSTDLIKLIRFLVIFSDIATKRTQFDNGEVFNSKKEIKN
jgi:hypothetical protein